MDLQALSFEELAAVVEQWPWFGAARKELSLRTATPGDAALYVGDRAILFRLADAPAARPAVTVSELLQDKADKERSGYRRRVRIPGGDYFSSEQYAGVAAEGDGDFASFAKVAPEPAEPTETFDPFMDICTETLAQIYAEQGYPERAKVIYSKLSLRYPEKNTYFAALIRKLDAEN